MLYCFLVPWDHDAIISCKELSETFKFCNIPHEPNKPEAAVFPKVDVMYPVSLAGIVDSFNFSFVGFGSFAGMVVCCLALKKNLDGQHTEQQTDIACYFPEVLIL